MGSGFSTDLDLSLSELPLPGHLQLPLLQLSNMLLTETTFSFTGGEREGRRERGRARRVEGRRKGGAEGRVEGEGEGWGERRRKSHL